MGSFLGNWLKSRLGAGLFPGLFKLTQADVPDTLGIAEKFQPFFLTV